MARGVSLAFLADVSGFLRGTDDVEGALDEVIDSLDDISTQARDTERTASAALDDIASTSSTAASDLEGDFRKAFDEVKADSRTAGDDISRNVRKASDDGISATGEFKGEAVQNFSEVASSFQGDMTTAVDGVQGLLGGLASALPGAGVFAAGAAAIGLGIARGIWGKAKEERERFVEQTNEAISSLFDGLIEGQGRLSKEFQSSQIKEYLDSLDSESFERLKKAADQLGLSVQQVARAHAGDAVALGEVDTALKNAAETEDRYAQAASDRKTVVNGVIVQDGEMLTRQGELHGAINAVTEQLGDTAGAYKVASDKADTYRDAVDKLGQSQEELPTEIEQTITLDTSQANGELKAWQDTPRFLDVTVNPVIDAWLLQNTMNKVRAQSERLLGP